MNYYINPIWFYLMDISDSINFVSCICAVLFIGIAGIIYFVYCDEGEEDDELRSTSKKLVLAGIIFFILAILCPSEKTCMRMMVAATVNKENVAGVKEEIYDIVDYIDEKLDDDKEVK